MIPKYLRRKTGSEILDHIRVMVANRDTPEAIESWLERQHGIEPLQECVQAAHSNPDIDNCWTCAPRWGWIGPKIVFR